MLPFALGFVGGIFGLAGLLLASWYATGLTMVTAEEWRSSRQDRDRAVEELTKLREQSDGLRKQSKQLAEQNKRLQQETDRLQQDKRNLADEKRKLEAQSKQSQPKPQAALATVKKELAGLKDELNKANERLAAKDKQLAKDRQEIEARKHEAESYKHKLEALQRAGASKGRSLKQQGAEAAQSFETIRGDLQKLNLVDRLRFDIHTRAEVHAERLLLDHEEELRTLLRKYPHEDYAGEIKRILKELIKTFPDTSLRARAERILKAMKADGSP